MAIVALLIIFFGTVNLLRITLLLIGSDAYTLKHFLKYKGKHVKNLPTISVIIPAYNESRSIIKTISSILKSDYPQEKVNVIVVDDGSTDGTLKRVERFLSLKGVKNVLIISQKKSGKAAALNNGIKNYAKGKLVMCLDADSYIDKNALRNVVKYFEDKKVAAVSSNVKIEPGRGLLNRIQQYEYLICYQMKRAHTFYNIEYIIGGIGSTFRRSTLSKIGYYDENTVTEDIDITMKLLRSGNKNVKVMYGSDVVAYTQSVLTVNDLIKQRYRWKWGRYQTFLKNNSMFFTGKKTFTKGLTWIYLPYALFGDLGFLLEPLFLFYIIATSVIYRDFFTLSCAFSVITFYNILNVLAEDTIPFKKKLFMLPLVPSMYFLFYILSYVEYAALAKSLVNIGNLKNSLSVRENSWMPVKRLQFYYHPNST